MLCKCAVENIGAAARGADNEYRTNYLFRHRDVPRFSAHSFLELYDIFIKYLQEMYTGLTPD